MSFYLFDKFSFQIIELTLWNIKIIFSLKKAHYFRKKMLWVAFSGSNSISRSCPGLIKPKFIIFLFIMHLFLLITTLGDRRCRDRKVVGFTTTCAINVYHH
jgi:hypothetical protein